MRRIAAGMGYRELNSETLMETMWGAHLRWVRLQEQIQQSRPS